MWLTTSVLEQRRFALHFLRGGADAVETAVTAYRNDDGGYGHALDPDLRGPSSESHHVARALRILEEIGRCGGPQGERVCRYLTGVSAPDGALPAARTVRDGHPTAPWIPLSGMPRGDLLTTGPVVGTLHRGGVWHPWLFRATDFCWAAVEGLERACPDQARAAVAFLDGAPDRTRARAAAQRLGRLVREQRLVVLGPDGADERPGVTGAGQPPSGPRFPHDFAPSPASLARRWFSDAEIDRSLDLLAAAQEADGGWPAGRQPWAPGSALEWRAITTVEALLTLRAYGRPVS